MPREYVFLSFAKYKELVDHTKKTNEIVTGYIKSKKPRDDVDAQSNQKPTSKPTKRPNQARSAKKPKKPRFEDQETLDQDETTQDGHRFAREEPPTPSNSEDSEEEAF